jgi:hypothetical protein
MNREEFEKQFGSVEIIGNAQKWIVDYCLTMATDDPFDNSANSPKLMHGKIYNIGFFREDLSPEKVEIDWENLAKNVEFLRNIEKILNDAGCYHSAFSDSDVMYYPIIFHERISPENFELDLMKCLGIAADFVKNPDYQKFDFYNVFDYEGFDDDDEMNQALSTEQIEAYRFAISEMNSKLSNIKDIAIINGFDNFPLFKIGQTNQGDWIGFISRANNRHYY